MVLLCTYTDIYFEGVNENMMMRRKEQNTKKENQEGYIWINH